MAKAFKARCPKPLLVGSHRLSARYMGGQVDLSKSGVKPEELVVERSS